MRYIYSLLLALTLSCSVAQAEGRKLEIVAPEYPPYYGRELEDNGFISEIIVEAFNRGGYETELRFLPWKRALKATQDGTHDGLFTIWHRPEREEWFLFSDPLPANELVFFKQADRDIAFSSYDELKPYQIGVVLGYAPPPGFADADLKTAEAKDDEQNLRKLLKGRVDLVLIDKILAQHIINTTLPEAQSKLEWIDPPAHVDIQYLVVSKAVEDHETIMAAFNKALAGMQDDGVLEEIMAKHGF